MAFMNRRLKALQSFPLSSKTSESIAKGITAGERRLCPF